MLFHSADKILVMACGVVKAMALCKEPIRLRMSPPSAAHVGAYMAVRDGEPSGTQPLTPTRGRNLCHSLMTPTWVGGPHINHRQTLETLGMVSYGSSWRTSAVR